MKLKTSRNAYDCCGQGKFLHAFAESDQYFVSVFYLCPLCRFYNDKMHLPWYVLVDGVGAVDVHEQMQARSRSGALRKVRRVLERIRSKGLRRVIR